MFLESCIKNKNVIINIGPGGVGKTSCSVVMALYAAKKGLRVGLLSIDPAKRLADALGLSLTGELRSLDLKSFGISGAVDAAMLDQKSVFDRMVDKYSPKKSVADKIKNHTLYKTASEKLISSLEYMALAKLQEMIDSKSYDLVILDTPPDTNALAFLDKPNVLAGFMDNHVMNWLIKPFHLAGKMGFHKLFTFGERLMGGIAKVTGFQALGMLSEFLVLMQNVIQGFHLAGETISKTLKSNKTGFVLVAAPSKESLDSMNHLFEKLQSLQFSIDGLIINRCLPKDLKDCFNEVDLSSAPSQVLSLFKRYKMEDELFANNLVIQNYFQKFNRVCYLEEQIYMLHNLEAMLKFSDNFKK